MAHSQSVTKGKPWFSTPGKPGDRTIEQQLMGLEPLFAEIGGKSVLDVGCAEGLISIECAKRGAFSVHGVEIRKDAVRTARATVKKQELVAAFVTRIFEGDANAIDPTMCEGGYDIILLLAILHKLRDPSAACRRLVKAAKDLVVVRLPPAHAPDIVDARSGGKIHRIRDVMVESGFTLERSGLDGPFGEWVGYYRRMKT